MWLAYLTVCEQIHFTRAVLLMPYAHLQVQIDDVLKTTISFWEWRSMDNVQYFLNVELIELFIVSLIDLITKR